MTKEQEMAILRRAVEDLGPDSYIGPWLADQLPFIEADIRADCPPAPTWEGSREMQSDILRRAADEATALVNRAGQEAAKMLEEAKKTREDARAHVAMTIRALADHAGLKVEVRR